MATDLPIRLGCVSFLNTLPLIEGLEKSAEVSLCAAPPSRLIDLLEAGEVDLALLSMIDAQRSACPVALLPVGMIACDGPTMTVRLYSRVPPGRIGTLHTDTDSHTAATLVRIILRRAHGADPAIVPFDARANEAAWPESLLLIGDKVVNAAPPAEEYGHVLDLGEAWKELTGLPFVYAAWACREPDASSPRIRLAARLLDRQRRHNATRLGWIAGARASDHDWPAEQASEYLSGLLRYDPGAPGSRFRAAVERFFDLASEERLTDRRRAVRWADEAVLPPAPATASL